MIRLFRHLRKMVIELYTWTIQKSFILILCSPTPMRTKSQQALFAGHALSPSHMKRSLYERVPMKANVQFNMLCSVKQLDGVMCESQYYIGTGGRQWAISMFICVNCKWGVLNSCRCSGSRLYVAQCIQHESCLCMLGHASAHCVKSLPRQPVRSC